VSAMTIGQLAARTGLSVRTLRFYADAGVLPASGRTAAGYRVWGADAVARARLLRTLRELGVGLDEVRRVLSEEASLADVARRHVLAIDAHIETLRLQRAVLRAVVHLTDTVSVDHSEELTRMSDLTALSADERRRIVEDYLEAVFGEAASPVADKLRQGVPELPADPTDAQVAAWVELAGLLRDPDYIASSRRMAQRALAEGPEPDPAQFAVGQAVTAHAGEAVRAGLAPDSAEALAVVERVEAVAPGAAQDRLAAAERIDAFTDDRVARYWTLVGIVNGWPQAQTPAPQEQVDAWRWYASALRAHAPS
jgi:DNA-binding transcriptional MerR regulator